jgi:hypothetical protein
MLKHSLLTLLISLFMLGCSAKEFNNGVESITSDISNAFEGSKDKSAY